MVKKELQDYIISNCSDRMIQRDIKEKAFSEFNLPFSITDDIICKHAPTGTYNDFVYFIIVYCINEEDINLFFNQNEIKLYKGNKYNPEDLSFPIKYNMIKVSHDMYCGIITAKELVKMVDAGMINYNTATQRTMTKITRGEKEIYKITVKEKSVQEIQDAMNSGIYIPNAITLNMPEDTDWDYSEKNHTLVINSIDNFDIIDGYHRLQALIRNVNLDENFDYQMMLNIVYFSESKAKQFIFQNDQQNKMSKVKSQTYNQESDASFIINKLNTSSDFNLKGEINKTGGVIPIDTTYFVLNSIIGKKKMTTQEKMKMVNVFQSRINYIVLKDVERFSRINNNNEIIALLVSISQDYGISDKAVYIMYCDMIKSIIDIDYSKRKVNRTTILSYYNLLKDKYKGFDK